MRSFNSSANFKHTYSNRNWLRYMYRTSIATFAAELRYNSNGNIRNHRVYGSYNSGVGELNYSYTYDNSNRLLKANRDSAQTSQSSHDLIMNYDKEGNFKSLKRYGANNNLVDNFTYSYFSGKNRLKNITSSNEQFSYDGNGNVIVDSIKQNYSIKYDWRNLITEIRRWRIAPGGSPGGDPPPDLWIYKANYWYDEAGNRICKKVSQWYEQVLDPGVQEIAEFPEEGDGSGGYWQVLSTTYYLRDITGSEVAIYSGNSIEQWNLLGMDNFGNVNSSGDKFFYLKDHLGTIRAVLDADNNVIEADDYDAWGYPLDGRCGYIGAYSQRYKFTGKERDRESSIDETGYDYFGARYYDSRVCRWGGVDRLSHLYFSWTPYTYTLNNPTNYSDFNGDSVTITGSGSQDIFEAIQDYADFDVKFKKGKVILATELSKKDYESLPPDQKALYDVICSSSVIRIIGLNRPYVPERNNYYVLGSGRAPGDDKIRYVHFKTAEQLQDLGVYNIDDFIMHEVLEASLQVIGGYEYIPAHQQVLEWVPWKHFMTRYGFSQIQADIKLNGNTVQSYWPFGDQSIVFFEHNTSTNSFEYFDVSAQLENILNSYKK